MPEAGKSPFCFTEWNGHTLWTGEAQILCRRHETLPGRHYVTMEWIGPSHWPVRISDELLRNLAGHYIPVNERDYLTCFPWPLRLIAQCEFTDSALYARADGLNGLTVPFRRLRSRLWNAARGLEARLVLTAHVWGLAYVQPGAIPSWRDLGKKLP